MKYGTLDYFSERLERSGFGLISGAELSRESLIAAAADASAIVVIAHSVDRELLTAMESCEFVMTLSVGYDCVDVSAASALGIPVSNCPSYCTEDVANHAIALLLAVSRKLHLAAPRVKQGDWEYAYSKPLYRYRGRTLGVIGLGRIGRAVVPIAEGIGMSLAAYDPYVDDDIFDHYNVRRCYELHTLLETADYVTVHAPLTGETTHLLDRAAFGRMKPHSVLINTARAAIVDEDALLEALNSGRIAGAGLDVHMEEPLPPDNPWVKLENVVLTPHTGALTQEAFDREATIGVDNIVAFLEGEPTNVVNSEAIARQR